MRALLALTVFGGSVAQATLAPALGVGGVTPDLPLIVVVLLALRRGAEFGCVAGFGAGLLQDAAGGGLIGRIVDVRPGASIVQVLIDPTSTVGAHVVRTRTAGIVEGDARGTLRFKYMARDAAGIQVGDLLVTSGQGELFPRGIPIGRVHAIDDRGPALFHYAGLEPAVDFARVDDVLLVTGETRRDLAAYFTTGG